MAHRAKSLPHDTRVAVMNSCFAAQYGYGAEFAPPNAKQEQALLRSAEQCLWGNKRPSRSFSIIWTVLYKGHAYLPLLVTLRACIALLYCIGHGPVGVRAQYESLWAHVDEGTTTPFHVLAGVCRRLSWEWTGPFTFDLALAHNQQATLNLDTSDWPAVAHVVREGGRWYLLSMTQLAQRYDLDGASAGIDFARTRQLLACKSLTFLQRGFLRTILSGAAFTPSRMLRAGKLTAEQAKCVHCDSGAPETSGHRYWQCPRWDAIRSALGLHEFPYDQYPRCLTRCGVVPVACDLDAAMCRRIQLLMVRITSATATCPRAQAQFALAKRQPNDPLPLLQQLAGEG